MVQGKMTQDGTNNRLELLQLPLWKLVLFLLQTNHIMAVFLWITIIMMMVDNYSCQATTIAGTAFLSTSSRRHYHKRRGSGSGKISSIITTERRIQPMLPPSLPSNNIMLQLSFSSSSQNNNSNKIPIVSEASDVWPDDDDLLPSWAKKIDNLNNLIMDDINDSSTNIMLLADGPPWQVTITNETPLWELILAKVIPIETIINDNNDNNNDANNESYKSNNYSDFDNDTTVGSKPTTSTANTTTNDCYVSPAFAYLAPKGGCDNLCNENERYTDYCTFQVLPSSLTTKSTITSTTKIIPQESNEYDSRSFSSTSYSSTSSTYGFLLIRTEEKHFVYRLLLTGNREEEA